jgi:general secretion pathway protein F
MSTFEYRGFDGAGRVRTGLIEGVDAKEARERVLRLGILVEELSPVAGAPRGDWRAHLSLADRAVFYHELSALLKAGLPLARALQMLIESPEAGAARVLFARLRDRVAEGAAFHKVLAEVARHVPPFETAVLEAAEKTGNLGVALEYLAVFLDEQDRLRGRIGNALVYPAIVVAAAILIGGGTLGVLVPKIGAVLAESQIPQPAITRWVVGVGRLMPWILGGCVLAGGAFAAWIRFWPGGLAFAQHAWEAVLERLPVVATARNALAGLRFARTLALLLRGGVPLVEALPLAGKATGRRDISEASESMAERVRHGSSLAEAVRAVPALGGRLPGWIQAGEAGGQLEDLLESAAARLQTQWERSTARWIALLEPALTLLVSAFVLAIALAVLLPILSMTRAL